MAVTQNTYTGNGSTVLYSFTFPYLETTDIKASVNGTDTTAYTLANATTVQFNTAPANGAAIRIYRVTDDAALAAQFYPGSAIRSQDLNDNFTQNLYVTQESNRDATAANTTSASAVSAANTAISTANSAVSTANTASSNASTALSTANTALSNSASAVTTANSADAKATTALDTLANTFQYTPIANVAAIPASPVDQEAVEIADSTGIQSFTPLVGLPGGFVGDSGLRVRIQYLTSNSSWNYLQYVPNDPEARYLNASGNDTTTGTLTAAALIPSGSSVPTNGVYLPSSNNVAISTNGTGRLFVDSIGLVGIRKAVPTALCDAVGSVVGFRHTNGSGTSEFYSDSAQTVINSSGSIVASASGANNFVVQTNSSERLRITSDGKVGIGTSAPSSLIAATKNVDATIAFTLANTNTGSSASSDLLLYSGSKAIRLAAYGAGNAGICQGLSGIDSIFNDFDYHVWRNNAGTERARIDSSGKLLLGTSSSIAAQYSGESKLQIAGTGIYNLSAFQYSNNAFENVVALGKSRGSSVGSHAAVQNGDGISTIRFEGSDGTGFITAAQISAAVDGTPGANDMPGRLVFSTTADGASSPTERMRIRNDGAALFGTTTTPNGTQYGHMIYGGFLATSVAQTGSSVLHAFYNPNGYVGGISTAGSSTAYATSSDYRLKENVVPLTGAIDRINQLQVRRFNFIADPDKTVDGFIAHEAQAVVPECVTGTKDEVDADGKPVYQGIDQSKLVPLLTAALQEALAEIESLKARVTALEP